MNKEMSFNIDDGKEVFAHEVSLNFTPLHFYLDFKSVTPRLDVRAKNGPIINIKHSVIMMDPFHVKEMYKLLGNVLKRYESEFGTIKRPPQLVKLDKKRKKSSSDKKESASVSPAYFG